ncbi:hypothetical protein GGS20DRAFT_583101 [Poronia punctata]|nr:hypothetical protein GGS20DRAFT_583101 [Poronia punctata]
MDDATKLASELSNKLAELDQSVSNYRQERAQEFLRYAHQLLHDVPEPVSIQVREVVANELMNYSALGPTVAADPTSPFLDLRRHRRCGRTSPPPVLPHTSGVPPHDTSPGSPHEREREREFHGLFIPSYLPLLEVMAPKGTLSSQDTALMSTTPLDKPLDDAQELPRQITPDTIQPQPEVAGNLTSENTFVLAPEKVACSTRRSALRRSSSSSAKSTPSPRRVRFDVEGEEVPTTASPPMSPRSYDLVATSPQDRASPMHDSVVFEEGEDEEGDGVLGSSPPRPKKISSTERLKALARSSTEDTSKWTVVGEYQEDDDDDEVLVMSNSRKKHTGAAPKPVEPTATNGPNGDEACEWPRQQAKGADHRQRIDANGESDLEADDLLQLPQLTSFKDRKRFTSPGPPGQEAHLGNTDSQQATPATIISVPPSIVTLSRQASRGREERKVELEEALFQFEEGDTSPSDDQSSAPQYAPPKYIDEDELEEEGEEEEEDDDQATPLADNSTAASSPHPYAKSPAVPVAKTERPSSPFPASSLSRQLGASAGSYNGKPFVIGVVRDEELHRKAAEMGDIYSFVGSVDGRSGVDESYSYHDMGGINGTPRSLGERLMEEAHSRRVASQMHKP